MRTRGFTLIELLIVVVIIGILATIAIPKFSATRDKAFLATMKADLKNLATQQEIYYNSAYSFSNSPTTLGVVSSKGITLTVNEASAGGWAATAVHSGLVVGQCGVYHGNATQANGSPATVAGVVSCIP